MNINLNTLYEDEINKKLLELYEEGTELFLVGGYIRDFLLNKECFDKDYAVKGEGAISFAGKAAKAFDGYFVLLDKEHDIARVVMPDKKNTLDFAGCVGQNILTDLKNRDFTINAIACKIEKGKSELIDPLNGIEDLNNKIIRTISEENIIDDSLRVLRAYRFAAQFGFYIENKTLKLIEKHKSLITMVSIERITQELIKLFEGDFAGENLYLMNNSGLLDEIFPELIPQRKVPPNLHHHLGLLEHSIECVRQIEILISQTVILSEQSEREDLKQQSYSDSHAMALPSLRMTIKNFPDWAKEHLYREFSSGIKAISLLKLATLLHDIGKPSTWQIDEEGRHRFIKHEELGSEMVLDVLKRLKFSKNTMKYIAKLIKYHMYPSQLLHEGIENLSEKAVMRMFKRIGDDMPELILLAMADRLSAKGSEITDEIVEKNIQGLYFLLEKYKKSQEEVRTIPKLTDGNEVMEILKIPPSPILGKILKDLNEAQISGDVNTREDALEFVKGYKIVN